MRTRTLISAFAVTALVLTPLVGMAKGPKSGQAGARAQVERSQHDFDRDRIRARDRVDQPAYDRDRMRDQDRTKAPDDAKKGGDKIYGQHLMTVKEQNQYREQLRLIGDDPQKRTKFMAQHREKMQVRAKAQGVDLDDGSETTD